MKSKSNFVCNNCGHATIKWSGKCNECNSWNAYVEKNLNKNSSRSSGAITVSAKELIDINFDKNEYHTTGFKEFDRVLGGGMIEGGLYLIGGEPGVGKSTLITLVLNNLNVLHKKRGLYISGEESLSQIGRRALRLGVEKKNFLMLNETSLQTIIEQINLIKPSFIVLDSIQTTISDEIASPAGSISQVREVTHELMNKVKEKNISCFIVGHITKEGSIAGPKILEHMVDTVIYFEGDQSNQYRLLRSVKNRFGSTNEIGIFKMSEKGLREVVNPLSIFINKTKKNSYGNSLSCVLQGLRPLVIEVQALIVDNQYGNGKRVSQGIDNNRVVMILAIIKKYLNIDLITSDIYINTGGGLKIVSSEMDLSLLISILSSYKCKSLYRDYIILGEISLTGEVKPIPNLETRLRELKHLGFKNILTSKVSLEEITNLSLDLNIKTIDHITEINPIIDKVFQ
ncbi:MAG: DNA repair protein RadA [Halobacteriovorax sp.]|nr:DNA repair protein RadA [Halobacteriovorax sp.]